MWNISQYFFRFFEREEQQSTAVRRKLFSRRIFSTVYINGIERRYMCLKNNKKLDDEYTIGGKEGIFSPSFSSPENTQAQK